MALNDIHTPVLLERCVELLAPALEKPGAVLVDATLGMGGHSEAFLTRFPELSLVGLDRDTDALAITGDRLARFGDRVHLIEFELAVMGRELLDRVEDRVHGAIADSLFGDVLAIDGEPVSTLEAFYKRLWSRPDPERTVELRVP